VFRVLIQEPYQHSMVPYVPLVSDRTYTGLMYICFFNYANRPTPWSRSPSWETVRYSASQEFFCFLWNAEVHYRAHNSPPLAISLSHVNPVHIITVCFLKIHFNSILPSVYNSTKWSFLVTCSDKKFCMHF
jgi:hypothetical protein